MARWFILMLSLLQACFDIVARTNHRSRYSRARLS